jgi:2'-5' RNA ligase
VSAAGPDPEERVRLFVALELPEDIRTALARWQAQAVQGVAGARPIAREDLHATLCFLGWCRQGEVETIRDACAVLSAYEAPQLTVGEAVWLPPRRPRVLAVELGDGAGALERAQGALSEVLAGGGWYQPEKRAYLAHVTVARVGRGGRAPRRELPSPPELSFSASRVSLYRSRLLRSGARYEPLGEVQLAG